MITTQTHYAALLIQRVAALRVVVAAVALELFSAVAQTAAQQVAVNRVAKAQIVPQPMMTLPHLPIVHQKPVSFYFSTYLRLKYLTSIQSY